MTFWPGASDIRPLHCSRGTLNQSLRVKGWTHLWEWGLADFEAKTLWIRVSASLLQVYRAEEPGIDLREPWMFVLHFLPLNVDNLIHTRPEACFPSFAKCPVSELPYTIFINPTPALVTTREPARTLGAGPFFLVPPLRSTLRVSARQQQRSSAVQRN